MELENCDLAELDHTRSRIRLLNTMLLLGYGIPQGYLETERKTRYAENLEISRSKVNLEIKQATPLRNVRKQIPFSLNFPCVFHYGLKYSASQRCHNSSMTNQLGILTGIHSMVN